MNPTTTTLVFAASMLSTQGIRENTGWLGIRITCLSRETCLPFDCCFSEPASKN